MSKSRLNQYLEAKKDVRKSNDPDAIMSEIEMLVPTGYHAGHSGEELLDLIITYGSVMEKKGYDAGYEQGKKWPK